MAVPNKNTSTISYFDIWNESSPNPPLPGSPSNNSFTDLFLLNPFDGFWFGNTYQFQPWGKWGSTTGADRIYGLNASNSLAKISDFSALTYYYDSSTYVCPFSVTNNGAAPTPPNNYDNSVNIDIRFFDSTFTWQYLTFGGNFPFGSTSGGTLGNPFAPIIRTGYWLITIATGNSDPTLNATITINGTTLVSGVGLTAASNNSFDSTGYGTSTVTNFTTGRWGHSINITIN